MSTKKYIINEDGKKQRVHEFRDGTYRVYTKEFYKLRNRITAGATAILVFLSASVYAVKNDVMFANADDDTKKGKSETEQMTEGFFSDWTEEEIVEKSEVLANEFDGTVTAETVADEMRFLDKEELSKTYAESDFMESVYYGIINNSGLDEMTEAAIDEEEYNYNNDSTFNNDTDITDRTDYFHSSQLFEEGSYEYEYLKQYEEKMDAVLANPSDKKAIKALYNFIVLSWSEEDSYLPILDTTADKVLKNSSACKIIAIDYNLTTAYPLIVQAVANKNLSDNITTKNAKGEVVLENANPIRFMEEEACIACENTDFENDDKEPDQTFDNEADPLINLIMVQEDFGRIRSM